MATFLVATGLAEAVTYKNNTMSEYLVTTKDLTDAVVSAMSTQQESVDGNSQWVIGFAIFITILGVISLFIILKKSALHFVTKSECKKQ
jgi:hypothetical protein